MNYTELSRKEQGALRYARQQARYRQQTKKKTRLSDLTFKHPLCPGIKSQTDFVSRWQTREEERKNKAILGIQSMMDALDELKGAKEKAES